MADDSIQRTDKISLDVSRAKIMQMKALQETSEINIRQEASDEEMTEWSELSAFNPLAMSKRFEPLEKKTAKRGTREEQAPTSESHERLVSEVEESQLIAQDYEQRNSELKAKTLLSLRSHLLESDTDEKLLDKIQDAYADHYLADEAMDYLITSSQEGSTLRKRLTSIRDGFNDIHKRDIRAGRNISAYVREFSIQGLGSPTGLRDLYRDITGNPRESADLFEELSQKFTFNKMRDVIDFVLHSIGSDMKAKGPSIDRAELQRLFTEARNMQAILGVYRFFGGRMKLILAEFQKAQLGLPSRINFELLSKLFVKLVLERYPSTDKIFQIGNLLGLSEEHLAQIIIYTQFRDAMRNVSPKFFKSEKHRQDLLQTIMESLGELEDLIDEEEEKEKEEEEKKKKKKKE